MNVTECKACKRRIVFAITEARGKRIPLDHPPERRVILVLKANGPGARDEWVARIEDTYTPHHITCPNADQFRKSKAASDG